MKRPLPAAACLALLALAPAAAHDLWIEPSSFRPVPGSEVAISLLVGQDLRGDPLPRIPDLIDRFVLAGAGPEVAVDGDPGDEPAGRVRVAGPGLHWIGYQSLPYPLALDPLKFEAYLKEEGLESVIAARAQAGLGAAPGRERFYRCAKSLLDVPGVNRPSAAARVLDAPLGFTLELVPLKNPAALRPGAELPVRLSFRGRPARDVLVVALCKDDPAARVSARTDAAGRVSLRLSRPGTWLLKAVHMTAAPPGTGIDWESWWASLSFEVASERPE